MRRLLVVALLVGCDAKTELTAEEVIVSLEPSATTLQANGKDTTEITVQTVSEDVAKDLKVKLTVQGAGWLGETTGTIEKELGPDGKVSATLLASRTPGTARVVAELAGYDRTTNVILVEPDTDTFTYSTSGKLTDGEISQVQVTVQPVPANGSPSVNTVVSFTLETIPASSGYLTTPSVRLDTATSATTTIVAGSVTTQAILHVDITPPTPAKTGTITIDRLP